MYWFENLNSLYQSLIASGFTWGLTALGSLIVCFFKQINKKILDFILGFSSGIMLSASFFSLLLPSLDLAQELNFIPYVLPSLGFAFGGLFVLFADKFLDKFLNNTSSKSTISLKRSILLILSITIHNIPEGMVIGVAFAGISLGIPNMTLMSAVLLSLGIGLQNFPEGAAVSLPLRREGMSRLKAFMWGQGSALVEPIAAIIGVFLVLVMRNILPFLLSFAAGSMVVVVARELLPESVRENKNLSTIGLMFGFVLMMVLDLAFTI